MKPYTENTESAVRTVTAGWELGDYTSQTLGPLTLITPDTGFSYTNNSQVQG